ncbi:MAG: EAL domain-containing protein [Acidobacteria bacterium]|nr:MAG: EAL domain-containing protein [Acidobacteriota bacterium]
MFRPVPAYPGGKAPIGRTHAHQPPRPPCPEFSASNPSRQPPMVDPLPSAEPTSGSENAPGSGGRHDGAADRLLREVGTGRESLAARRLRAGHAAGLEAELLEVTLRPAASSIGASLFVGLLLLPILWPHLPTLTAVPWLLLHVAVCVLHLRELRGFRREPHRRETSSWLRLHLGLVFLGGLVWGLLGSLMLPTDSLPHRLLVCVALLGLCAASSHSLVAVRYGTLFFSVPCLVPTTVRLFSLGDGVSVTIALLNVAFVVGVVMISLSLQESIRHSLSYRVQNEHLIDELAAVNSGLLDQIEAREGADRELAKRDAILEAVSVTAERLLQSNVALAEPEKILALLGKAADVPRISLTVFEQGVGSVDTAAEQPDADATDEGGGAGTPPGATRGSSAPRVGSYHEWLAEAESCVGRDHGPVPDVEPRWADSLQKRRVVTVDPADQPERPQEWLQRYRVASLLLLPVFRGQELWGVLGLEDSESRSWTKTEIEALTAACEMLGTAALRIETEQALATSDRRYRMLAENTRDLVAMHELSGKFLYASPSIGELLGVDPDEATQRPFDEVLGSAADFWRQNLLEPASAGETVTRSYRATAADGAGRWLETTVQPLRDPDSDEIVFLLSASRDITTRREAEEQLFQEKEMAQVTLRSIGDGVVTLDRSRRVQFLNTAAAKLTGWDPEKARGLQLVEFFDAARTEETLTLVSMVEHCQVQDTLIRSNESLHLLTPRGDERALEISASPIHDFEGTILGSVIVLRDVTRTERLAAQLTYQATHDSLTGLLNRREFENRLISLFSVVRTAEVTGAQRPLHALCYLDLDQFKVVNDTCGHIAGDELLRQVAAVLTSRVRKTDTVARLGGDEFGILLHDCPIEKAMEMSQDLCDRLREHRFSWDQQIFRLGTSIGVVEITGDARHVAELLSAADAACYAAKDQGRGRVHRFTPDDLQLAQRAGEMRWIGRIHSALESERLRLRYQPILEPGESPSSRRRIEILLSMVTETGDEVPPGTFIPAAERFNAMNRLDRWVVQRTVELMQPIWHNGQPRPIETCFINLSGTSMADESFLLFLKELIRTNQIPQGALCFEVTETAAVSNLAEATRFMQELRRAGCLFALDDFGSGVSSFGYLRSLPIDFLKIDGTFVRDVHRDSVDRAIVESIRNVARQLQVRTIAEFVESEEALRQIVDLEIDLVQGYALARPRPLLHLLEELEIEA